jgi:hypothetical protein
VTLNDKYAHVALREPPPTGYLYLAGEVEPTYGPTPIPRSTSRKAALLGRLKACAGRLAGVDDVTRATVYTAAMIPPLGQDAKRTSAVRARYDVTVLVETSTVNALPAVQASPDYQELQAALAEAAGSFITMPARCLRLVADVDKSRDGLFLFNHFVSHKDQTEAVDLWEHLAAWYAAETGLDNSTLLGPLQATDYVFVNHARWDRHPARFALQQLTKPSFHNYVRANLRANQIVSMPILYHLA